MKRGFIYSLFLSVGIFASAQKVINGLVTNQNSEPIPFAHVRIGQSYRGTISNSEGRFTVNVLSRDSSFLISAIGYATKELLLEDHTNYSIQLSEETVRLNEVVILGVDRARQTIEKAIENIEVNYPSDMEMITGFLRERYSKDSLGSDYYHISEAEVEVQKESYSQKADKGNVRLIKGRSIKGDTASLTTRIVAGAHLANRFDFVMRREGPLNFKNLKDYICELTDTTSYGGLRLFEVSYSNEDLTETGRIYIQDSTFSVVKIEQRYVEKFPFALTGLLDNSRKYLNVNVEYFQTQETWRLSYIDYQTAFERAEGDSYLNSIFSSHDYVKSTEDIPYHERIQFGDLLLEQTSKNDSTYWDGVNISVPERLEEIKEPKDIILTPSKKKTYLEILRKIEFGYQFFTAPYATINHDLNFSISGSDISQNVGSSQDMSYGVKSTFGYRIKEHTRLLFSTAGSLGKGKFSETRLGISQQFLLSETGRWYLTPALHYAWSMQAIPLGTYDSEDNFKINKMKFDSEQLKVFSSSKFQSMVPSLTIEFEKSNRLSLLAGVDFYWVLNHENGLWLEERENWLKRKFAFAEQGDLNLRLNNTEQTIQPMLQYFIGVNFRLP